MDLPVQVTVPLGGFSSAGRYHCEDLQKTMCLLDEAQVCRVPSKTALLSNDKHDTFHSHLDSNDDPDLASQLIERMMSWIKPQRRISSKSDETVLRTSFISPHPNFGNRSRESSCDVFTGSSDDEDSDESKQESHSADNNLSDIDNQYEGRVTQCVSASNLDIKKYEKSCQGASKSPRLSVLCLQVGCKRQDEQSLSVMPRHTSCSAVNESRCSFKFISNNSEQKKSTCYRKCYFLEN